MQRGTVVLLLGERRERGEGGGSAWDRPRGGEVCSLDIPRLGNIAERVDGTRGGLTVTD